MEPVYGVETLDNKHPGTKCNISQERISKIKHLGYSSVHSWFASMINEKTYNVKCSVFILLKYRCFSTYSSEHTVYLSHLCTSWKFLSRLKLVTCIHNYSRITIYTFSFLWNRRPCGHFFSDPNKVTTVEWMVQKLPVIRRNSCVVCGVGLSCWKITPGDRCLGWFLRVVAASYSWRSRRFMCPLAWLQCWWILLQLRVHMA